MAAAVLMPTVSFRDESHDDWHEFEVLGRDEPKSLIKTSSMQSEKDISMDPESFKSLSLSSSRRNESFDMMLLPAMSPPRDLDAPLPLPLQPLRTKFVSRSLPNSTATSPRQRSGQMRSIKSKEQDATMGFRRSKSCGEGRVSKRFSLKSNGNSFFIKTESSKSNKNINTLEDGFKCNALCLYLPGFGKAKPLRSSRKDDYSKDDSSLTRTTTMTSTTTASIPRVVSVVETTVISARASMEKFDCGSWTTSAVGTNDEKADSGGGGHFFDLPSELIKNGSGENDQDDPVSAAFVFDKEPIEKEIKGVLKMSGSKNRKSMESLRHVRFSTSSPVSYPASPTSSISPRLLEATKNFNAFLEAQAV